MGSRCRAELCEMWNGDTCVCAAMDGDPDAINDLADWAESLATRDYNAKGPQ